MREATVINHDVLRFDVSMYDALAMYIAHYL